MIKKHIVLAIVAVFFSAGLHAAVSCRNIPTLDISKHKVTTFSGSLLRYEQECWYLPVKAGQHLQVKLSDNNGNSALTIYKPGATIKYGSGNPQDEDPANYYHGETIKGTPADGTTTKVDEVMNETGNYLLVVGLSLGAGSEFKGTAKAR